MITLQPHKTKPVSDLDGYVETETPGGCLVLACLVAVVIGVAMAWAVMG